MTRAAEPVRFPSGRQAALASLILFAPAAAAADEPRAPHCRLTPAECALVLHEVAVDSGLFAQDAEIVGLGLSPGERAKALIQRDVDRMAARFPSLAAPIAAEVRRIQLCQSLSAASAEADPRCR